jgi:hypothetical protein
MPVPATLLAPGRQKTLGDSMSIDDALVDRLSTEAGRRLVKTARAGRRQAVERISRFAVTVTRDGVRSWEEIFEHPPTLEQIRARVGGQAFVVAVRIKRKSLRERFGLAIAAE